MEDYATAPPRRACRTRTGVASVLVALFIAWSGVAAGPVQAQRSALPAVTWQMATEYPASNVSGVGLVTFSKLVAERTHGQVTTENAFDNSLRITSREMFDAARDGRIAGGDAFAGPLDVHDAIFALPSLPFLVQSFDDARALNAKARPLYERALAARGLKLLYVTFWPSTGLWSDRALTSADDLSALSIRTYDDNSAAVMRATGAKAEFLPLDEAIVRIKAHQLNAVLTSGDGGAGRKLWDDLHYFTPINYANPISIAFVRTDAFEALPQELQIEVVAAATETEQRQIELLRHRTEENYARMRSNGVNIAEQVPAELVAVLKRQSAGAIAAWSAKAAPQAVDIVNAVKDR